MSIHPALLLVSAALLGLGGCAAAAAGGEYDPRLYIRECTQVQRAAQGPADAPATYAAVHHLADSCPDYAVERLPELWMAVPADTAVLLQLLQATGWRGEGRPLFDALAAAATDSARPVVVRIHALAGLADYYVPGTFVLEALQDTSGFGHADHVTHASYDASSSILPADKDRVRRMLYDAWAREADRVMWHAYETFLETGSAGIDRWDEGAATQCQALEDSAAEDPLALFAGTEAYSLRGCTSAGPAMFARAWAVVTADSAALESLLWASQTIRDRRTLDAVLRAGADPSRPLPLRFAALHTAATLADPAMYTMGVTTWMRDPEKCYGWWGWHHHHAQQEDGAVPLSDASREEIRGALARIARSADHPQVGQLATLLSRCIRQP
jgi:hypothetical protein